MSKKPTPSKQLALFHFEPDSWNFEDFGHYNGFRFWWARDLGKQLGYDNWATFSKVVNKAMRTLTTLEIPYEENFVREHREIDGQTVEDIKLSKFACYLTAMQADGRKQQVAVAQAYFATVAAVVQKHIEDADDVERVAIRSDISDRERTFAKAAQLVGVHDFARFQNKGYRGLYEMSIGELRELRGIPANRSPLDYMGSTEMAANLFRLRLTEERLRREDVFGQAEAEDVAFSVGQRVRKTVEDVVGVPPEALPSRSDIKQVHTDLKRTQRKLKE